MTEGDDYVRTIEQRFVALRGKGYALSARDIGLVLEWRALGLPLRLVMGAVEEGMRRRASGAGDGRPLTLSMFARAVTAAATKWAERGVTRLDAAEALPPSNDPFGALAAALEPGGALADERVGPALMAARARLEALRVDGVSAFDAARTLDGEIGAALLSLTVETDRAALVREIEARLDARMSAEARREALDAEVQHALRARFGVPELVMVLLDAD